MRIISLVLFILISMDMTSAQNLNTKERTVRTIHLNEIKSEKFKGIYEYYQASGFLKLPINFDRNYRRYLVQNDLEGMRPHPYQYANNESPFYVNVDKKDKKWNKKDSRICLFNQTNGNYIVGVVMAVSPGYEAVKRWLVTFSFSGEVIDYIPIYVNFVQASAVESQINRDFTVDVYRIDFPGNDYIIKDYKPLDNLKGQRIDTKYQITSDGKFEKISEVRYQPQIYSPEMLLDKTINIRERGEKPLNKQNM